VSQDWADRRARELIEMDRNNGGVSLLAGYIAQALRVERREAYERGGSDAAKIVKAARMYREEESGDTPRMWRGKKLQDLANDLDDALAAFDAREGTDGQA
jgi:hypothetical protein